VIEAGLETWRRLIAAVLAPAPIGGPCR
jgi:hypothetical protein